MGLSKDSDRLVESARSGDEQAMMELIKLVMPVVESEAGKAQTFGAVTGYDLVQEGMLGFLNAVFSYREGGEASFLTYAGVCIKNSITSALRAQGRKKHRPLNSYVPLDELDSADKLSESDPESVLSMQDNIACIMRCIEQDLTELERRVIKLHIGGSSYEQTARQLGISTKSVDNALTRARKKIKAASNT